MIAGAKTREALTGGSKPGEVQMMQKDSCTESQQAISKV
jgi:hypothetical protein